MSDVAARFELLDGVSRLLEEGSFSSTYKYALLLALVDCCAERRAETDGTGDALPMSALAARVIELFWSHTRAYAAPNATVAPARLDQAPCGSLTILGDIARAQTTASTLALARRDPRQWSSLLRRVSATLWKMPIHYLQNVGGETIELLYPYPQPRSPALRLLPGVAAHLVALAPILRPMIQNAWMARILRFNPNLTGHAEELGRFLFGADRESLLRWRPLLRELQHGCCFYCDRSTPNLQVDHFIPWARYPADLAENFVGACARCNGQKSDWLAAESHVERWTQRNALARATMASFAAEHRLACDLARVTSLAISGYQLAERRGSLTWQSGKQLVHLSGRWRAALGTGAG